MSRFGDDMGKCSKCKKTINLNLVIKNDERYCHCSSTSYHQSTPPHNSFITPEDYYADSTYCYSKTDQQHMA